MKTKVVYVLVFHSEAVKNEWIKIERVNECLNAATLGKILQSITKYGVNVFTGHKPKHAKKSKAIECSGLDDAIICVKNIKLYKEQEILKRRDEIVVSVCKPFKLSTCFELEVPSYSDYCTFFSINPLAKDVAFNPEPLMKTLGIKVACNGKLYMRGKWRFINTGKVEWIAEMFHEVTHYDKVGVNKIEI